MYEIEDNVEIDLFIVVWGWSRCFIFIFIWIFYMCSYGIMVVYNGSGEIYVMDKLKVFWIKIIILKKINSIIYE